MQGQTINSNIHVGVTNTWYTNMDNGLLNGVIFLDLREAFDCVDRDVMFKKRAGVLYRI